MTYIYVCNKCGKKIEIEQPMTDPLPKDIKCKEKDCNGVLNQDFASKFKTLNLSTPEDYKATSEYHSVDYGDDYAMAHALGEDS